MKSKQLAEILFLSMFVLTFFQSCRQQEMSKKKIVYVDSYHRGHPSSDDMMDGIMESFPADSFEIITYFMDNKRNTSLEFIENRAAEIYDSIADDDPDMLIVSDDNAVKYLVQPYIQDRPLPVVFYGVNMSADQYNLPRDQVTGMIEMLPLADLLLMMKPYYPSLEKLLLLSENTTTSRKEANRQYDIIYIVTHAAAKKILGVTPPAEIPITKNRMSTIWINTSLAEKT
ncbi:MAG: hypothetical protein AMS23_06665, partial [Bacteroides sp. SM1_62]